MSTDVRTSGWELFRTFTWLGLIGFGGPAAHLGLMNRELVQRKSWIADNQFYQLMAFTNLLPGPNSTQLAMAIGYEKAGMRGLWLSGLGFIWPAVVFTTLIAAGYRHWMDAPLLQSAMLGIQAIMFAVIAWALVQWGKTIATHQSFEAWDALILFVFAISIEKYTNNEIIVLAATGLLSVCWRWWKRKTQDATYLGTITDGMTLIQLFWAMTKIGSVLYGSGYVLFAFLKRVFVDEWQLVSLQTISDAIAVGQMTPGPLFASATYVGYVLHGIPGAMVATAGIFLPAFVFVAIFIQRIKQWQTIQWIRDLLDGVQYASYYLLITMSLHWAQSIFGEWDLQSFGLLVMSLIALFLILKWKVNSVWLLLAGGSLGAIFI